MVFFKDNIPLKVRSLKEMKMIVANKLLSKIFDWEQTIYRFLCKNRKRNYNLNYIYRPSTHADMHVI